MRKAFITLVNNMQAKPAWPRKMTIVARLLAFMVCFMSVAVHAQVTASFNITDSTVGCGYKVLHFRSAATGYSRLKWDLGNGTTSTADSASTSYVTAGSYTVSLTAYSATDSSIYTKVVYLPHNVDISFTASDTAVCPKTGITFHNTSTSVISGPITYNWVINGTSFTSASPVDTFTTPGYYTIYLVATNSMGCSDQLTVTDYIHVLAKPAVAFNTISGYLCKPPYVASFLSTTTGSSPFTNKWKFIEDGAVFTDTAASASHTYTSPQHYNNIRLIVTDANGCTDSVTHQSVILDTVRARYTTAATACIADSVIFTNQSNTFVNSKWYFGDATSRNVNTDTVQHRYAAAGLKSVQLVVNDGHCADTAIHALTVNALPTPSIAFTPRYPCSGGDTMYFYANVAYPSATWNFGDGLTGTGDSFLRNVLPVGIDSIVLSVIDINGCRGTARIADTIYDLNLAIIPGGIPGFDQASGCGPYTAHFDAHFSTTTPSFHTYPVAGASYSWSFGDGSFSTGTSATITHAYTAVGIYEAHCWATTTNGCIADEYATITVSNAPSVSFTTSTSEICNGNAVIFTPHVTAGAVDYYQWHFGDGSVTESFAADMNTPHVFSRPGVFNDTLFAYSGGCGGTYIMPGSIVVDSPLIAVAASYSCTQPNHMDFSAVLGGADAYLWMFGDGTTSTALAPSHNFPAITSAAPVTYTVALAAYNAASGCRDTVRTQVSLFDHPATFTSNDTNMCPGMAVVSDTSDFSGLFIYNQYKWYVNSVLTYSSVSGMSYVNDTLPAAGIYHIALVATDIHGCQDTAQNTVHVGIPLDSFSVSRTNACGPRDTITFTDITTNLPGRSITGYSWRFADGTSLIGGSSVSTHIYNSVNTTDSFKVTEVVTDNIGCVDSSKVMIKVYHPKALFTTITKYPCLNIEDSFHNGCTAASGYHLSYAWDFGDGSTSVVTNPRHAFAATGIYTVTLRATDTTHGCYGDTALSVNVTSTDATLHMDDSVSVCYPKTIHFSTTFADTGRHSSVLTVFPSVAYDTGNATFTYAAPGLNTVTLISANSHGCADTVTGHMKIYGYVGDFLVNPHTGLAPLSVTLGAEGITGGTLNWDFGDGITSSVADTSIHTYSVPGIYVPHLFRASDAGCTSISSDTIKVDQIIPQFNVAYSHLCAGIADSFTNVSTSVISTIAYSHWDFGDGDTSNLANPVHAFTSAGSFTVNLTVTNALGVSNSTHQIVTVYAPPVILGTGHTTPVCAGTAIALLDSTTSGTMPLTYSWNGPSGYLSVLSEPVLPAFSSVQSGTYSLVVTDANGCTANATTTVNIDPLPLVPSVSGIDSMCQGSVAHLSSSSAGGVWSSSNTLIATVSSIGAVNGLASGTVDISYTVSGSCITLVTTHPIYIAPLPSVGTITGGTSGSLCRGTSVSLSVDGGAASGTWSTADPSVASISASGLVTGESASAMPVNVMYSASNACGTSTAYYPLVVKDIPTLLPIIGLDTLEYGSSIVLHTSSPDATTYLWSVSDPAMATITVIADTIVTIHSVGLGSFYTVFTAGNTCGNSSDSMHMFVSEPVHTAGTITGNTTLCAGSTSVLSDTSSIAPGVWSSSNTSVATINATGLVTAIAAGTTNISYSISTALGTASAVITLVVNPQPVFDGVTSYTLCNNALFADTLSSSLLVTDFTWSRVSIPGVSNASASGSSQIIDEYLNNITSSLKSVVYNITLTSAGCTSTSAITVNVEPTPMLTSALADTVCSGTSATYHFESNIGDVSHHWSGAGTTGIGDIYTVFLNNTKTIANKSYVDTLIMIDGGITCEHTENISFTIAPSAVAPSITTHTSNELCSQTYNMNFGAATLPDSDVVYNWTTSGGAEVFAQGSAHQYSLVNFLTPGRAVVYLSSALLGSNCVVSDSFAVEVGNSASEVPEVSFFNNDFICLRNDMDAYQWGFDNTSTLDSTLITGETNQSYHLTTPDLEHNNYWVITNYNGCMQKTYYNTPAGVQQIAATNPGEMKVYPNPASGILNVEIQDAHAGSRYTADVRNSIGQEVKSIVLSDHKGAIDVTELPSGIYFIDCYSSGVKISSKKFVKN